MLVNEHWILGLLREFFAIYTGLGTKGSGPCSEVLMVFVTHIYKFMMNTIQNTLIDISYNNWNRLTHDYVGCTYFPILDSYLVTIFPFLPFLSGK